MTRCAWPRHGLVTASTAERVRARSRVERRFGNVRAFAFKPGTVPDEIQLWDVGPNPTDYGVHYWTERSARLVMETYEKRGNPLQIDVEHGALPESGGYAALSIRDGAPWLTFDWSAFAIEQIETKARLFLSPEYDVDPATGEIVGLVRVSLVADPGTHNARKLARAISASTSLTTKGHAMDPMRIFLAALKAALNADDPEAGKQQALALVSEMEKAAGGDDTAAPPPDGAAPVGAGAPPPDPTEEEKRRLAASAAAAVTPVAAAAQSSAPAPTTIAASAPAPTRTADAVDAVRALARAEARAAVAEAAVETTKAEAERQRITARNAVLPESLRAFAPADDKAFGDFVKAPEIAAAIEAHAKATAARTGGVRASTTATRGDATAVTGARSSKPASETERVLAQAFGSTARPEKSYEVLTDGRLRLTHLSRPVAARRV